MVNIHFSFLILFASTVKVCRDKVFMELQAFDIPRPFPFRETIFFQMNYFHSHSGQQSRSSQILHARVHVRNAFEVTLHYEAKCYYCSIIVFN